MQNFFIITKIDPFNQNIFQFAKFEQIRFSN